MTAKRLQPAEEGEVAPVMYHRSRSMLQVGRGVPVAVNASVGTSRGQQYGDAHAQAGKINELKKLNAQPDMVMDLSIHCRGPEPFQLIESEFDGPVGVLPHYKAFDSGKGIDPGGLLRRVEDVIEKGCSFVTIHASPTKRLWQLAESVRDTPITSRGGGLIVRDMFINRRGGSVYLDIWSELLGMLRQNGVVLNLGTAFRAASVVDGFDEVHREEVDFQKELIQDAREKGVQVVLEGPGHVSLSDLVRYIGYVRPTRVPLMPLGPICTDAHADQDHVVSAIGAALMMCRTRGGIINAVTCMEHRGSVPDLGALAEGIRSARVAATVATSWYSNAAMQDERVVAQARSANATCVVAMPGSTTGDFDAPHPPGCDRCADMCPLVIGMRPWSGMNE